MSGERLVGNELRDLIEDEIVTGKLAPGERLDEVTLSNRHGVSRTPVRQALHQLSALGLVDVRPRRGATVSAPDIPTVLQMFEVMAELEAMCGRLAARRLSPAEQAAIAEALDGCRLAALNGDSDAYYYENEGFHQAIYMASGNSFLVEQVKILQRRMAPFRRIQLRVRNRLITSLIEHERIVDAIFAGDGEKASRLLREHITIQGESFSDFLASLKKS
jgi:DNA-binding GntR family transcriptional regulator